MSKLPVSKIPGLPKPGLSQVELKDQTSVKLLILWFIKQLLSQIATATGSQLDLLAGRNASSQVIPFMQRTITLLLTYSGSLCCRGQGVGWRFEAWYSSLYWRNQVCSWRMGRCGVGRCPWKERWHRWGGTVFLLPSHARSLLPLQQTLSTPGWTLPPLS